MVGERKDGSPEMLVVEDDDRDLPVIRGESRRFEPDPVLLAVGEVIFSCITFFVLNQPFVGVLLGLAKSSLN